MKRARCWLPALAILWLAFALRVDGLARFDFWYDEAGQALAAQAEDIRQTLRVASRDFGSSPLDHLVTRLTVRLVGDSEFGLRFAPAAWNLLTVAVVFACGEALRRGLGGWAALYAALSPFAVRYAQELRFYALGLLLGSLLIWLAILVARGRLRPTALAWVMTALLAAATLYTHVYSFLAALGGLAIIALASPRRPDLQRAVWYAGALLAGLIAFSPWLLGSFNARPHPFGTGVFGAQELRIVLAGFELLTPTGGTVAGLPEAAYPAAALGLSLAAILLALFNARRAPWLPGLALAVGVSALLVIAATLSARYFFSQRQFLFLLPARALLFGFVLLWLVQQAGRLGSAMRWVIGALLVVGLAVPARSYIVQDLHHAEPERSRAGAIAAFIAANYDPGRQAAWFVPFWMSRTVNYYLRRRALEVRWERLQSIPPSEDEQRALREAPRGSVVVLARDQMGLREILEEAGFEMAFPPEDRLADYELVVFRKR